MFLSISEFISDLVKFCEVVRVWLDGEVVRGRGVVRGRFRAEESKNIKTSTFLRKIFRIMANYGELLRIISEYFRVFPSNLRVYIRPILRVYIFFHELYIQETLT